MAPQDFSPASYPPYAGNGGGFSLDTVMVRTRPKYWLHGLLFLLTLATTTIFGAGMMLDFQRNAPFDVEHEIAMLAGLRGHPAALLLGLPFSLTLLTILLAHEFGHYLACRYYEVDASLPYFLPAPTLTGTFGAFIRIRSAILSKRILFDIGIAGPLAGFALLVLPMAAGVSLSKVVPGIGNHGELVFGTPLILRLFEWIIFPGVPVSDIYLHPVARAAWVGVLATALNLLPIGQLDGGHVLYAFLGERTRLLSRVFIGVLVLMGFFFAWSWFFWAAFLVLFGMRHPAIFDPSPVGRVRTWLGIAALIILILSFTPTPIRTAGL